MAKRSTRAERGKSKADHPQMRLRCPVCGSYDLRQEGKWLRCLRCGEFFPASAAGLGK